MKKKISRDAFVLVRADGGELSSAGAGRESVYSGMAFVYKTAFLAVPWQPALLGHLR